MANKTKGTGGPSQESNTDKSEEPLKTCGIVMPISALDDCSEQHWSDVFDILQNSIESAGFRPNLVSNADEVGIIQKRIIQNLYENPIVVCDVSGKNPNVMFELGMRLAFDKPTIIVKDDKTSYSFDTAPIEHLEYPRDLRYADIVEFKGELARKISSTYKKASEDKEYTTFLKNFGTFTVAKLDTKEVDKEEFILDELKALRQLVASQSAQRPIAPQVRVQPRRDMLCVRETTNNAASELAKSVMTTFGLTKASVNQTTPGHFHLSFPGSEIPRAQKQEIVNHAADHIPSARWLGAGGAPHIRPSKAPVSQE